MQVKYVTLYEEDSTREKENVHNFVEIKHWILCYFELRKLKMETIGIKLLCRNHWRCKLMEKTKSFELPMRSGKGQKSRGKVGEKQDAVIRAQSWKTYPVIPRLGRVNVLWNTPKSWLNIRKSTSKWPKNVIINRKMSWKRRNLGYCGRRNRTSASD